MLNGVYLINPGLLLGVGKTAVFWPLGLARRHPSFFGFLFLVFFGLGTNAPYSFGMCARYLQPGASGSGDEGSARYVSKQTAWVRAQLQRILEGQSEAESFEMPEGNIELVHFSSAVEGGLEQAEIGRFRWVKKTSAGLEIAFSQESDEVTEGDRFDFLIYIEGVKDLKRIFCKVNPRLVDEDALAEKLKAARMRGDVVRLARSDGFEYFVGNVLEVNPRVRREARVTFLDAKGELHNDLVAEFEPDSFSVVEVVRRDLKSEEQEFLNSIQAAMRSKIPVEFRKRDESVAAGFGWAQGIPERIAIRADGEPMIWFVGSQVFVLLKDTVIDSLEVTPRIKTAGQGGTMQTHPFTVRVFLDVHPDLPSREITHLINSEMLLRVLTVLARPDLPSGSEIPRVISEQIKRGQMMQIYLEHNSITARISLVREARGWRMAGEVGKSGSINENTPQTPSESDHLKESYAEESAAVRALRATLTYVSSRFTEEYLTAAQRDEFNKTRARLQGHLFLRPNPLPYLLAANHLVFGFDTGLVSVPPYLKDLPLASQKIVGALKYLVEHSKAFNGLDMIDHKGDGMPAGGLIGPYQVEYYFSNLVSAFESEGLVFKDGVWVRGW